VAAVLFKIALQSVRFLVMWLRSFSKLLCSHYGFWFVASVLFYKGRWPVFYKGRWFIFTKDCGPFLQSDAVHFYKGLWSIFKRVWSMFIKCCSPFYKDCGRFLQRVVVHVYKVLCPFLLSAVVRFYKGLWSFFTEGCVPFLQSTVVHFHKVL